MEKENYISVWVGNLEGKDQLADHIAENYDDEGNMTSGFMNDFRIDHYDADLIEVLFDASENITEVFNRFSYSENFSEKLPQQKLIGRNCFIVIYDLKFEGEVKRVGTFEFIGTFKYR
ncbi:immunity 22 family protein [Flavobacterium sp.]|uniref:immunity 22 family protein n=1 Tax=Flavobacterium sp. TaxID=239 RepID=UPI004033D865